MTGVDKRTVLCDQDLPVCRVCDANGLLGARKPKW
jgi:hypothetical protein